MGRVLGLRTCRADGTSHNGFFWPREGPVAATDWDAKPVCGYGLHALKWGEGDASLLNWSPDALWQVVEFEESEAVDLDGKVKFAECIVRHTGTRQSATQYLHANGGAGQRIVGLLLAVGDWSTLTGGDRSELRMRYQDGHPRRCRTVMAYVGEAGIKPGVPYRLDGNHRFVEVQRAP